jgi:hypothetical protein
MLTMLNAEQKAAVCARIDEGTRDLALRDAIAGYCASLGLRQPQMCSDIRDACIDGPEILPVCPDTIPDCPSISQDEFVSCRVGQTKKFVDYNHLISCNNPSSIPTTGGGDPQACIGPYERCPALRSLAR